MQKAFKAFFEGRSQCCAAEMSGVPHSFLQRYLRTGQVKQLKNNDRRTIYIPKQDLKLSSIVKLSAHGFRLDYNNDLIYPVSLCG